MANNVRKELEELKNEILNGMPRIVARTAKDYFQDTFKEKAFDGKPWPGFSPNYKHRTNGSLMIDSSKLLNSIRITREEKEVVEITAGYEEEGKVDYARAHNEGFTGSVIVPEHKRTSKKGKTFVVKTHTRKMFLPQRQFIGEARELDELIEKRVNGFIASLIKNNK